MWAAAKARVHRSDGSVVFMETPVRGHKGRADPDTLTSGRSDHNLAKSLKEVPWQE